MMMFIFFLFFAQVFPTHGHLRAESTNSEFPALEAEPQRLIQDKNMTRLGHKQDHSKSSKQNSQLPGEKQICGFTSESKSPGLTGDSEALWRDFVALHLRERSRGCSGRYLVWECKAINSGCGGLGDEVAGIAGMLAVAIASGRALLLDWQKQDMPYFGGVYDVNAIDWSMPQACSWHESVFTMYSPFADSSWADKFLASVNESTEQVVRSRTNQMFNFPHAVEKLPALKQVFETMKLPRGCTYHFLFRSASPLSAVYEQIRIRGDFVGIHVRAGDKIVEDKTNVSQWTTSISKLAKCVTTGIKVLGLDLSAPVLCSAASTKLVFFSDSAPLKELSANLNMTVTGVKPMHVDRQDLSKNQHLEVVAELHALADASVIVSGSFGYDGRGSSRFGVQSGFARLAVEIGKVRNHENTKSFVMKIVPNDIDICVDEGMGEAIDASIASSNLAHDDEGKKEALSLAQSRTRLSSSPHNTTKPGNYNTTFVFGPVRTGKCVSLDRGDNMVSEARI